MIEKFSGQPPTTTPNPEKQAAKAIENLARPLVERCEKGERFKFSGITELSRRILEEENAMLPPEYQYDLATILEKFTDQGMRVVMTRNGSNVMIMPGESDDVNDNLRPHHLEITDSMESELKSLIELSSMLQSAKRVKNSQN